MHFTAPIFMKFVPVQEHCDLIHWISHKSVGKFGNYGQKLIYTLR